MSVVLSKRDTTELTVVTKSRELAKYTITICSNNENFPKKYRWCLTSKIVDAAITISNEIIEANSIYIDSEESLNKRKDHQTEAMCKIHSLLSMIDLAYVTFGIESSRIEYWTGLVLEVQALLRNWRKSDKARKF